MGHVFHRGVVLENRKSSTWMTYIEYSDVCNLIKFEKDLASKIRKIVECAKLSPPDESESEYESGTLSELCEKDFKIQDSWFRVSAQSSLEDSDLDYNSDSDIDSNTDGRDISSSEPVNIPSPIHVGQSSDPTNNLKFYKKLEDHSCDDSHASPTVNSAMPKFTKILPSFIGSDSHTWRLSRDMIGLKEDASRTSLLIRSNRASHAVDTNPTVEAACNTCLNSNHTNISSSHLNSHVNLNINTELTSNIQDTDKCTTESDNTDTNSDTNSDCENHRNSKTKISHSNPEPLFYQKKPNHHLISLGIVPPESATPVLIESPLSPRSPRMMTRKCASWNLRSDNITLSMSNGQGGVTDGTITTRNGNDVNQNHNGENVHGTTHPIIPGKVVGEKFTQNICVDTDENENGAEKTEVDSNFGGIEGDGTNHGTTNGTVGSRTVGDVCSVEGTTGATTVGNSAQASGCVETDLSLRLILPQLSPRLARPHPTSPMVLRSGGPIGTIQSGGRSVPKDKPELPLNVSRRNRKLNEETERTWEAADYCSPRKKEECEGISVSGRVCEQPPASFRHSDKLSETLGRSHRMKELSTRDNATEVCLFPQ
eukprot:TRINITY_DN11773_c0_g2_i1.p1 TRINITY_DN11773_c0_g2~~TRINITY_DN11773_c0_g2_i1.p1  ORF type:complete len:597 (+),score=121.76 TRINITY_DN11773_c0_g2_i1:427-2217(+)